jgi:hypothetical protein
VRTVATTLPRHFSPHSLRHTFASLLLQQGESPAYVQRQLGHASIQLTVDTYGKWLPLGNVAAVDRLDERPSGNKMVTKTESGTSDVLEVPDSFGGPSRTRTLDPLIKRRGPAASRPSMFLHSPTQSRVATRILVACGPGLNRTDGALEDRNRSARRVRSTQISASSLERDCPLIVGQAHASWLCRRHSGASRSNVRKTPPTRS